MHASLLQDWLRGQLEVSRAGPGLPPIWHAVQRVQVPRGTDVSSGLAWGALLQPCVVARGGGAPAAGGDGTSALLKVVCSLMLILMLIPGPPHSFRRCG